MQGATTDLRLLSLLSGQGLIRVVVNVAVLATGVQVLQISQLYTAHVFSARNLSFLLLQNLLFFAMGMCRHSTAVPPGVEVLQRETNSTYDILPVYR